MKDVIKRNYAEKVENVLGSWHSNCHLGTKVRKLKKSCQSELEIRWCKSETKLKLYAVCFDSHSNLHPQFPSRVLTYCTTSAVYLASYPIEHKVKDRLTDFNPEPT